MALQAWEKFKGVTNVRHDQFNQNLLYGLLAWMKWSAINAGAYQNVSYGGASGILGGDFSRLRMVTDPRYTNGQVWETFRSDLVWETGIGFTPAPQIMSGVYVNGSWHPTPSSGTDYEHYIDYPRGRVVFNTAIATTSTVHADYSYRTMSFIDSNTEWFKELLFNVNSIYRDDFLAQGSGQWDQLSDIRQQLPVCGIEIVDNREYTPYQLGGGQWVHQDILIYILTENKFDRDQWLDILSMQNDRTVYLLNRKIMKEDSRYPVDLDYRGMTVNSPIQYPQLVLPTGQDGFRWTNTLITDTRGQMIDTLNGWLYRGVVRMTCTVIRPDV
jgi:hypothetical protein